MSNASPPAAGAASRVRPGYLLEVQGLRTVAALLVALYHIWLHRVSGGVDVFFVVAAYFLTAGLIRREPLRPHHLADYYAATARRVVPGAALVIAATALAALVLMPELDWGRQIGHAFASLTFTENWHLVETETDYLQRGLSASPYQQMWALSLQVQIYLVFPLLYGAASLAGQLSRRSVRNWAIALFLIVFLLSLAYSIYLTRRDQDDAYFNSLTRVWEFAAGSLLALTIDRIRLPRLAAKLIGWAALAALLLLGVVVNVAAQFPGYLAGIPVLAAMAVIVASANGAELKILTNRPVVAAADMSFAFYLWHWPLLIFMRYRLGSDDVGLLGGLAVVIGAALLAYLSTRFVETPFRRWQLLERRNFASLAACLVLLLVASLAPRLWNWSYETKVSTAHQRLEALLADPSGTVIGPGETIPAAIIARDDNPPGYDNRCHQDQHGVTAKSCIYGDEAASRTVVLVGGSHSLQWLPALDAAGKADGFRVVSMTKSSCLFIDGNWGNSSCPRWNRNVLKAIVEMRPDLVVTIATRQSSPGGHFEREYIPGGYPRAWQKLADAGLEVLAIRDNPWFTFDVVACVVDNAPDWSKCDRPREQELSPISPTEGLDLPKVTFADFSDLFCDETNCTGVDDGILKYRDRHHLTKTFVLLHQDRLAAEVAALLPVAQPG